MAGFVTGMGPLELELDEAPVGLRTRSNSVANFTSISPASPASSLAAPLRRKSCRRAWLACSFEPSEVALPLAVLDIAMSFRRAILALSSSVMAATEIGGYL